LAQPKCRCAPSVERTYTGVQVKSRRHCEVGQNPEMLVQLLCLMIGSPPSDAVA
jgi:hypothetical protein